MRTSKTFSEHFETLTDHEPFPWQQRLYERFVAGDFPETCSLPTGLGKTSVVTVWLLALAARPMVVPRRLVYVVNRRTVVDQTTNEVETLRQNLPKCPAVFQSLQALCALPLQEDDVPLAVSTLRGQFADNQEWSADPSRPAVICGTVDMIGSRLLFSGYRCGFKTKPLQAGFLGQDVLLVHDEAHLEPAFQELLEAILQEQQDPEATDRLSFKVMALSATNRSDSEPFELQADDYKHKEVRRRIEAVKSLHLHPLDDEKQLAATITELALAHRDSGRPVVVFARTITAVNEIARLLGKAVHKSPLEDNICVLTGTMRGQERDELVKKPVFKRFLNKNESAENSVAGTVWLVCTSAGEVGVNISADHLVCDLSTFDSMAQRFGRVNRFGRCDETRIDVVHSVAFPTAAEVAAKPVLEIERRRQRTLLLLQRLEGDASSKQLEELPTAEKLEAFAPEPETLPATEILFDAWSLTSIFQPLPGRPPVQDYLHGVAEWEPPRTQVAWRQEVELLPRNVLELLGIQREELLADYPLKPQEILTDRSDRIYDQLKKLLTYRRKPKDMKEWDCDVWVLDDSEQVKLMTLAELVDEDKKNFAPKTILLPPAAGGLSHEGLFDPGSPHADDIADDWYADVAQTIKRRARSLGDTHPDGMRLVRSRIDTKPYRAENDADENDEATDNDFWYWYTRPASADDDGSRSSTKAVAWQVHTNDVTRNAELIAAALLLHDEKLQKALDIAARAHDLGKCRRLWQRGIGNFDPDICLAKPGPRHRQRDLTRYRHEFGSLLDLLHTDDEELRKEFAALPEDYQDVVLHLIAVHHGRGRPHFPANEAFDPGYPQDTADALTREVPRRFARLQRRFGRWGLAWMESLLRAADYAASKSPSEFLPAEPVKAEAIQ